MKSVQFESFVENEIRSIGVSSQIPRNVNVTDKNCIPSTTHDDADAPYFWEIKSKPAFIKQCVVSAKVGEGRFRKPAFKVQEKKEQEEQNKNVTVAKLKRL